MSAMTTLRSGTPLRNMLTTTLTPSGPLGNSGVARVWLTYSGASNSSRRSILPCSQTSQNCRMMALLSFSSEIDTLVLFSGDSYQIVSLQAIGEHGRENRPEAPEEGIRGLRSVTIARRSLVDL